MKGRILLVPFFALVILTLCLPSLLSVDIEDDTQTDTDELQYHQIMAIPSKTRKHTRVAINYADRGYNRSAVKNCYTAKTIGGFDGCTIWRRNMLDSEFVKQNQETLDEKRGAGYWLWKPYIILKTLHALKDGDYVMYTDAGSYFISDVDPLFRIMERENKDILLFRLKYFQRTWTKRDTFILTGCDYEACYWLRQLNGAFSVWRKSPKAINFLEQWLRYAKDPRMLTDMPNTMGKPNLAGFKEHRHDQAILTILAFQNNITTHRDPSQYNTENVVKLWKESPYPQLIQHTRRRK